MVAKGVRRERAYSFPYQAPRKNQMKRPRYEFQDGDIIELVTKRGIAYIGYAYLPKRIERFIFAVVFEKPYMILRQEKRGSIFANAIRFSKKELEETTLFCILYKSKNG